MCILAGMLLGGGVVAATVLGSGELPASAAGAQHVQQRAVVAQPGDSLWAIAEATYDPAATSFDFQSYVDALVEMNGGATIEVGQRVLLP